MFNWRNVLLVLMFTLHGGYAAAERTVDADRIGHFGVGEVATTEQIAGWDIDIRPDGQGLPPGSGSVADGEILYETKCAECHGSFGEGVGRYPVLAGGQGSLTEERPERTVGSFWPWTSTLFDYIRRAMPYTQPQSLSIDETYAITAYVLYLNEIVTADVVLDQGNLASIMLPNQPNFVPDPRPDTRNRRCMKNCVPPESVVVATEIVGMSTEPAPEAAATSPNTAKVDAPGKPVYDQFCSICHQAGVGGAPILGDEAAWSARLNKGTDALLRGALEGISSATGVMPAKGGFTQLTDEEVAAAVNYMVEESS